MKTILTVFLLMTVVCTMAFAAETKTPVTTLPSLLPVTQTQSESDNLLDQIKSAKDAGLTPDAALYTRLHELMPSARTPGAHTDQAGGSCDAANSIASTPYSDTGTLDGSNDCPGRPYHDVFYVYTAEATGYYTVDMCGSAGDAYLRIWTGGTCCSGPSVTADDNCGLSPSTVVFLQQGQVVYFECGSYSTNETNLDYNFNLSAPTLPPANDNCANAEPITVNAGEPTCASTLYATPDCQQNFGYPEVWYSFTLDGCTNLSIGYCGTTLRAVHLLTVLNVGSCCGDRIQPSSFDYSTCEDNLITLHFDRLPAGQYWLPVGFDHRGDFCVQLTGEACCEPKNYCADPIVIGPVTDYTNTTNTCCATNSIDSVWSDNCQGTAYASGPDVIYKIVLNSVGHLNLSVQGPENSDEQIAVFTDCADPHGTCMASQDRFANNNGGESINGLELQPGTYYVSTSYYQSNVCEPLTIHITSDVPLPVNLLSFSAEPGDNSITLNWNTASETGLDRFDIVRDGEVVESMSAANAAHSYRWMDTRVHNGRSYNYELVAVDVNGGRQSLNTQSATPTVQAGLVTDYMLHQNFPNPFNPTTEIVFDMKERGFVSLDVYNLLGQKVATLVNDIAEQGRHIVTFDATYLPSGLYICRMQTAGFHAENKMLLMK